MERHKQHKALVFDPVKKKWVFLEKKKLKFKGQCQALYCSGSAEYEWKRGKLTKVKFCYKCKSRRTSANNRVNRLFVNLKASAKRRDIPFDITYPQFYLFCLDTNYFERDVHDKNCMSVDRIDATLGYSIDNIQMISMEKNSIKNRAHQQEQKHNQSTDNNEPF